MRRLFPVLLAALVPLTARAASITPNVTFSNGTTYNTTSVSNYSPTPAQMAGSIVKVTFFDGTSSSGVWGASGASNTGWSLTESGTNTYFGTWSFSNLGTKSISGFEFNGVPGSTTFDVVTSPTDTPGSSYGLPFSSVTGPTGLTVNAMYTNRLLLNGVFYGDEYTDLSVNFGNTTMKTNDVLTFRADTDVARVTATPEPSSLVFLGTGLVGVAAAVRRRLKVGASV